MKRKTAVFFLSSLLFSAACTAFLTSCTTKVIPDDDFKPTKDDVLTDAEKDGLVYHAQRFVSRSKKLRLLPEQRELIMNTRPTIRERYTGHRYGKIELEWKISKWSVLTLTSDGPVDLDEIMWKLQIKTTSESNPVPEGFIKEHPDDVAARQRAEKRKNRL